MSTRIAVEHSRSREVSSSGSIATTDGGAPSSPREVPSLSPTTGSHDDFISDEEDWDPVDDIEPSESASRPASRPPPAEKGRSYVEPGPPATIRRDSSRPRLPPAPEPLPHRPSRREQRDPREYEEAERSRPRHQRRRDPSSHSDSVGSHEHPYGHGRIPYGHGPPPHPSGYQQYEYVQHHGGYAPSSVGSQGPVFNPFTGNPMPPPGQLIQYQQPHPAYYPPPNPAMSQFSHASPLSPSLSSHSSGYFDPHRMPPPMPVMPFQYYPSYPMHPMHGMPPMMPPPPGASPAEEDKFNKLQEMMLAQERARMAREDEREAKMEAARKAAEADAAKKASEREAAVKLADAEKKAKAAAEAEAESKAKEADEKHKKALDEMKKKAEAAEKAEKEAKKAEEEAKKEAAARPPDLPIKFKDAVGRTFSFPWSVCKSWKSMENLIKQAFLHVEVLGQHVQEGHYDLMGPNGEIILPQVWESTVEPDWTVTMHMWPMTEDKKDSSKHAPAVTVVSRTSSSERGWLGRRRSKKSKSPPAVKVPARKSSNVGAVPPPPPPAPSAPPMTIVPDTVIVEPSNASHVIKERRAKSKEPVPPLLAWSAASMRKPKSRR